MTTPDLETPAGETETPARARIAAAGARRRPGRRGAHRSARIPAEEAPETTAVDRTKQVTIPDSEDDRPRARVVTGGPARYGDWRRGAPAPLSTPLSGPEKEPGGVGEEGAAPAAPVPVPPMPRHAPAGADAGEKPVGPAPGWPPLGDADASGAENAQNAPWYALRPDGETPRESGRPGEPYGSFSPVPQTIEIVLQEAEPDPRRRVRWQALIFNGSAAAAGWYITLGPMWLDDMYASGEKSSVADGVSLGVGLVLLSTVLALWARARRFGWFTQWLCRIPLATAVVSLAHYTPDSIF